MAIESIHPLKTIPLFQNIHAHTPTRHLQSQLQKLLIRTILAQQITHARKTRLLLLKIQHQRIRQPHPQNNIRPNLLNVINMEIIHP